MSSERLNSALAIGDRLVLWGVVAGFGWIIGALALRADRDPPALISPACVTTPSKVPAK